jgi:NADH:ubiquinone oxidoreductase subunit E
MDTTLEELLERQVNVRRESLIPILQEVQDCFGYISEEAIAKVSGFIGIPSSKVYGIASFYDQFRFSPPGRYHVRICRGTACHLNGTSTLLKEFEKLLRIQPGQTTRDGLFSLEMVPCLGVCGKGPILAVNQQFYIEFAADMLKDLLDYYRTLED